MSSLYRQHILQHYKEPQNRGVLEHPDLVAEADNPNCGDHLQFTAMTEQEVLAEVRFDGDGCALSIAAASLLTEDLKGRDVDEVKNISQEYVFSLMGLDREEVSPMRHPCVLLAWDVAQEMSDQ